LSLLEFPEVQLLDDGDLLWVAIPHLNAEEFLRFEHELRCIPGAARFEVIADGQLRPSGRLLPCGFLPAPDSSHWQAISDWIDVRFPATVMAADLPAPTPIKIVRGSSRYANSSQNPVLLQCRFLDWLDWAEHASEVRLNRLSFACDDQGDVLVRGEYLPPLKGTSFVEYQNVAVPVGFLWTPQISVAVLNEALKTDLQTMTVLCENGESGRVELDQFVAASRSAVRLTAAEVRSQR